MARFKRILSVAAVSVFAIAASLAIAEARGIHGGSMGVGGIRGGSISRGTAIHGGLARGAYRSGLAVRPGFGRGYRVGVPGRVRVGRAHWRARSRHWRGYGYGWGYYAPWYAFGWGLDELPYYYGDVYPEPLVTDEGVAYCIGRFHSYDPVSQTYLGYDGRRHSCP